MTKCRDLHYAWKDVSTSVTEPITLTDAKAWLRVTHSGEDALLTNMITMARRQVERDTGLILPEATFDLTLDAFPEDPIQLPAGPLQSVTSVVTTNAAGTPATCASSVYQVDAVSMPPRIILADDQAWPTDIRAYAGIVIRCVMGYDTVPVDLLEAVYLQLQRLYYREAKNPDGYDQIVSSRRLWGAY